jgi:hypothetical protein
MHKNVTKCNETLSKWCKNKHRVSKIIDTFEMYQQAEAGDSGPQGSETPVCLAQPWNARGLDGPDSSPKLGQRLLSPAGDSGAGVT